MSRVKFITKFWNLNFSRIFLIFQLSPWKKTTILLEFFPYLAQIIISIRGCVACNDLWPWPIFSRSFGFDLENRVRSVASTVLDGFFPYLIQMITGLRRSVACDDLWPWPISSRSFDLNFENRVHSVTFSVPDRLFFWLGIQYDSIVWVIMRRRGVSSERRRSSCSSLSWPRCVNTLILRQNYTRWYWISWFSSWGRISSNRTISVSRNDRKCKPNFVFLFQNLATLCTVVVDCASKFCVDFWLQTHLHQCGVLWHLLLFLFNYDYTLEEGGVEATQGTNQQVGQCWRSQTHG